MLKRLRAFPWRSTALVLWHGFSLAIDAARLIEQYGVRNTTAVPPFLLVALALSDTASNHPDVVQAFQQGSRHAA